MQQEGLTPAQYARLRGLNRSTVCRQIAAGVIPTMGDGMIDPKAADAARERNLDPCARERAAVRKANRPAGIAPSSGVAPSGETTRRILLQISGPEAVLGFARLALRAGCTPLQSYILGNMHGVRSALALDSVDPMDLGDLPEASETQWAELLGRDFDFERADVEEDRITLPDLV
jgi:hypothetical protein